MKKTQSLNSFSIFKTYFLQPFTRIQAVQNQLKSNKSTERLFIFQSFTNIKKIMLHTYIHSILYILDATKQFLNQYSLKKVF